LRLADQRMYAEKHGVRTAGAAHEVKRALLSALAQRDPELGNHLDDVGRLAEQLARELRCPESLVEQVRIAAELHDVGKMAIPEAILTKPGALSPGEWVMMHQHTVAGERIISASTALADIAPLVRASHERWDGAGYPDGLAGESIPWGARIIAVCDSWHAMTSDRTYRSALGEEAALAELRAGAGAQFDPEVVEAFLRLERPGAAVEPAPAGAARGPGVSSIA
jgi:HD-GYP domain-containing protein (c-di-GMP phosphodiesterase class II)